MRALVFAQEGFTPNFIIFTIIHTVTNWYIRRLSRNKQRWTVLVYRHKPATRWRGTERGKEDRASKERFLARQEERAK